MYISIKSPGRFASRSRLFVCTTNAVPEDLRAELNEKQENLSRFCIKQKFTKLTN